MTLPENRKLKTVMKSKIILFLTSALIYIASTVCAEETYTYGPIKPGDMLWTIAGKVSPSTVSRHQAIIALHRINAHAFRVSCNVNSLKVGETLRIPSLSEMLALNKASATKEFTLHDTLKA
jgi:FimV-like protein